MSPMRPAEAGSGSPPDRELSPAIAEQLARWDALVRRVGGRFGFDAATLDELQQDIRIRLWRAHDRAREKIGGVPSSYVYEAVMSAAVDLVRRRQRARARLWSMDAAAALEAPSRAPTEHDVLSALDRALVTLAVDRRVAVRLHLEGRSLDDIIEFTGWSPARARNLLYRGLDDLRAVLGEGDGAG
jgi:RNA polymerase sigma factor (sigma-70 family)